MLSNVAESRMPQAAGAAYALKLDDERQGDCVICYFGDGTCRL